MQIFELGEQLGEGAEVARSATLIHALYGILDEEAREQRKLEQLVEQAGERVVGVLGKRGVALGQRSRLI
jgi:hypothetical protein